MIRLRGRAQALPAIALAALIAAVYLIVAPPSTDLAAHVYRADLFGRAGFAIWDNGWYGGHHTPGYSVLFPPAAWLLGPRLAGALAVVAATALFAAIARRWRPDSAVIAGLLFASGAATDLFTGRLAFGFGLAPALAALLALQRDRTALALALAVVTALCSPVAALFLALAGGALLLAGRRASGLWVAVAALAPVAILAVAFPEGGSEPFPGSALWPIPVACAGFALLAPRRERVLRTGALLYLAGCLAAYLVATPVGSNAARLGPLIAAPLAAAILRPRRRLLLIAPLLALLVWWQWDNAISDLHKASRDPAIARSYYAPLLGFLAGQGGPPARVEIPFTLNHWEAAWVAPRFPLARGWERQLDREDNALFYRGPLTAGAYRAWLAKLAVRFVAVPDSRLDSSAKQERALIARGLPYLRPVWQSAHWVVYSVAGATPIVAQPGRLDALGADALTITAPAGVRLLVRVRWTPYWRVEGARGCTGKDGAMTYVRLRTAARFRLAASFAIGRIGATSARCS
jgi:hypothetical protein